MLREAVVHPLSLALPVLVVYVAYLAYHSYQLTRLSRWVSSDELAFGPGRPAIVVNAAWLCCVCFLMGAYRSIGHRAHTPLHTLALLCVLLCFLSVLVLVLHTSLRAYTSLVLPRKRRWVPVLGCVLGYFLFVALLFFGPIGACYYMLLTFFALALLFQIILRHRANRRSKPVTSEPLLCCVLTLCILIFLILDVLLGGGFWAMGEVVPLDIALALALGWLMAWTSLETPQHRLLRREAVLALPDLKAVLADKCHRKRFMKFAHALYQSEVVMMYEDMGVYNTLLEQQRIEIGSLLERANAQRMASVLCSVSWWSDKNTLEVAQGESVVKMVVFWNRYFSEESPFQGNFDNETLQTVHQRVLNITGLLASRPIKPGWASRGNADEISHLSELASELSLVFQPVEESVKTEMSKLYHDYIKVYILSRLPEAPPQEPEGVHQGGDVPLPYPVPPSPAATRDGQLSHNERPLLEQGDLSGNGSGMPGLFRHSFTSTHSKQDSSQPVQFEEASVVAGDGQAAASAATTTTTNNNNNNNSSSLASYYNSLASPELRAHAFHSPQLPNRSPSVGVRRQLSAARMSGNVEHKTSSLLGWQQEDDDRDIELSHLEPYLRGFEYKFYAPRDTDAPKGGLFGSRLDYDEPYKQSSSSSGKLHDSGSGLKAPAPVHGNDKTLRGSGSASSGVHADSSRKTNALQRSPVDRKSVSMSHPEFLGAQDQGTAGGGPKPSFSASASPKPSMSGLNPPERSNWEGGSKQFLKQAMVRASKNLPGASPRFTGVSLDKLPAVSSPGAGRNRRLGSPSPHLTPSQHGRALSRPQMEERNGRLSTGKAPSSADSVVIINSPRMTAGREGLHNPRGSNAGREGLQPPRGSKEGVLHLRGLSARANSADNTARAMNEEHLTVVCHSPRTENNSIQTQGRRSHEHELVASMPAEEEMPVAAARQQLQDIQPSSAPPGGQRRKSDEAASPVGSQQAAAASNFFRTHHTRSSRGSPRGRSSPTSPNGRNSPTARSEVAARSFPGSAQAPTGPHEPFRLQRKSDKSGSFNRTDNNNNQVLVKQTDNNNKEVLVKQTDNNNNEVLVKHSGSMQVLLQAELRHAYGHSPSLSPSLSPNLSPRSMETTTRPANNTLTQHTNTMHHSPSCPVLPTYQQAPFPVAPMSSSCCTSEEKAVKKSLSQPVLSDSVHETESERRLKTDPRDA